MRNGGKKWSGSRSDSILLNILFFFQREMERFSRVEKAEEWEQHCSLIIVVVKTKKTTKKTTKKKLMQRPYLEQSA